MVGRGLEQFAGENYLNLETYRKSGQGVATPVWFAEEAGTIYVYTLADSGKVKRIRNNPEVRIAPCDMRGGLKGDWVEARARVVGGDEASRAHRLLNKKYWMKRLFDITSKLRRTKRVTIAIEPRLAGG